MELSAIGTVVGLLGGAGGIGALIKAFIDAGRRREQMATIRRDLDHAYDKIRCLEEREEKLRDSVGEMKGDVKHILETLNTLVSKFDRHLEAAR